jgi:hypothetical protein
MASVKENWLNSSAPGTVSGAEEVPGTTKYGWQASVSGSPDLVNMWLEGSIDGATWFTLDTFSMGANPHLRWVIDKPVNYLRVNFVNASGGTSPTATVSVIAV